MFIYFLQGEKKKKKNKIAADQRSLLTCRAGCTADDSRGAPRAVFAPPKSLPSPAPAALAASEVLRMCLGEALSSACKGTTAWGSRDSAGEGPELKAELCKARLTGGFKGLQRVKRVCREF